MLTRSPMTERTVQPGEAGWRVSPLGLLVPDDRPRYERPVGIDLFAGAGGFSCGFHQAGFHMAAAVEMDYWSAITYMVNLGRPPRLGGVKLHFDTPEREEEFMARLESHMGLKPPKPRKDRTRSSASARPADDGEFVKAGMTAGSAYLASHSEDDQRHGCHHFFVADVRNITGAQILDALGMEQGDVACVVGGPPCQGFSAAGRRNVMDPRNSLVFEFARLVCEIMPRTFVMENVPGIESMVTTEGVPVIDAFCAAVSDGGYGEYDSLRKALQATGGRAVVRGTKAATRVGRDDEGQPVERPAKKPTAKARKAAKAAQDVQPDLLSLLDEVEVAP